MTTLHNILQVLVSIVAFIVLIGGTVLASVLFWYQRPPVGFRVKKSRAAIGNTYRVQWRKGLLWKDIDDRIYTNEDEADTERDRAEQRYYNKK